MPDGKICQRDLVSTTKSPRSVPKLCRLARRRSILRLLAWYLADPRPAGDAAMNLAAQSLGSRLGIGRNGKVDEIGHANLHFSNLVRECLRRDFVAPETPISGRVHKESIWIGI